MKPGLGLLLLAALLSSPKADAYVSYNRLGYVSCNACHSLPTGGGSLSSYGQSVQAAMSGFSTELIPPEQKITHGFQAHVIGFDSDDGAQVFLMQADYLINAVITDTTRVDAQLGPSLKFRANTLATLPPGWDAVVARRLLISRDLNDTDTIQFGRDLPVSALNIGDHTSFARSRTRRGVYDYPTQLRYIRQTEKLQLLPFLNAPSFEEGPSNREFGGGLRAEYLLNNSNSVGGQYLYGNTATVSRNELTAFARLSRDHWNGLVGQYVLTFFDVHSMQDAFAQQTLYVKPYVAIPEWIETGFVLEHLRVAAPFEETAWQYGPEVNVRVNRFVSILGDGRKLGSSGNSDWSWYGQLFLHVQI